MKKVLSFLCGLLVVASFCSCATTESYEDIEYCLSNRVEYFYYGPSEKYENSRKELRRRDELVRSERFWTYLESIFEKQWKGSPGFDYRKKGFDFHREIVEQFGLNSSGAMRTVRSKDPEEDCLIVKGMLFVSMYVTGMEMGLEAGKNIVIKVGERGGIKFEEIYNETISYE